MMKYFAVNVLTRSANLPIYKSYALKNNSNFKLF